MPSLCKKLICLFCLQLGNSGTVDNTEDWEKVWDHWRPLTMAGIFDCWEPPEGGDLLYSYTIITMDSCKSLHDIHHRQAFLCLVLGINPSQFFLVVF